MTDAEIEAGLIDTLAREISDELHAVRDVRHGELIVPIVEICDDIVARLRAARISDATIRNVLVHEPRRAREYYASVRRLRPRLQTALQAGDTATADEIRQEITSLSLAHNIRYGK